MRLTPTKYYADINFTMYDVLVLKEVPIDVVSVNGDVSLRVISFSKENVTFALMGKGRISLKISSLDASARYMLYVKKGGKDILIGDYLADEKEIMFDKSLSGAKILNHSKLYKGNRLYNGILIDINGKILKKWKNN